MLISDGDVIFVVIKKISNNCTLNLGGVDLKAEIVSVIRNSLLFAHVCALP